MPKSTCSVDDCSMSASGRGLCATHYRNIRLYGRTEGALDPVCETCQAVFTRPGRGGPLPRWCSRDCNPSFAPRKRSCKTCGDEFDRGTTNRTHCSNVCTDRWRASKAPIGPEDFQRECARCGDPIDFNAIGKGGRRRRLNVKTCTKCRRRPSPANGITVADLVERDGSDCAICGAFVDLNLAWPHRMSATRDHVIPIIAGGPDVIENLQLAHFVCNVLKSDKVA